MLNLKLHRVHQCLAALLVISVPVSTAAVNVLLILLAISWILQMGISDSARKNFLTVLANPFCLAILFYFFVYIVGSFYSLAPWSDVSGALRKASLLLFVPILLFCFQQPFNAKLMLRLLNFTVTMVVLCIFFLHWNETHQLLTKMLGIEIKDRIFLGLFAVTSVYLIANDIRHSFSWSWRIFCIFQVLILGYFILFFNDGRSGHVLFFVSLVLFCFQNFGLKKGLLSSFLVISAIILLLFMTDNAVKSRFGSIQQETEKYLIENDQQSSTGERLTYLNNYLQLYRMKPVMGWGTGALKYSYEQQFKQTKIENPHNQFLYDAVQHGILGVMALLVFFVGFVRAAMTLTPGNKRQALGLICLMFIGCMLNSWLRDFSSAAWFVVLSSLLFSNYPEIRHAKY